MAGATTAAAQPEQGQAVLEHMAVLVPAGCRLGTALIRGWVASSFGDGCPRALRLEPVAPQRGLRRAGEALRMFHLAECSARPDDVGQTLPAPVSAGGRCPAERLLVFLEEAER